MAQASTNAVRGGGDRVALQQLALAQLAFQLPVIQFVLPALRVEPGEFACRGLRRLEQARPQPQLLRAVTGPPDPHANLAQTQPACDLSRPGLVAQGHLDQPAAVLVAPQGTRLEVAARAKEKMAAHARARRQRLGGKGRAAVQPIGQQQRACRQPRQKPSASRRRQASGCNAHCINSSNTCHGKRWRRSEHALSLKLSLESYRARRG